MLSGYIECHIFRIRLYILFLSTFFKTLLHTKSSHCLGNIVCKNSFFLSFLSNIILQQTINNNVCSACVLPTYLSSILTFCHLAHSSHLFSLKGPEGYRIPSEEDYYQQDPTIDPMTSRSNNVEVPPQTPSISSSTKKSKPMPKESSFFIFSSKNR